MDEQQTGIRPGRRRIQRHRELAPRQLARRHARGVVERCQRRRDEIHLERLRTTADGVDENAGGVRLDPVGDRRLPLGDEWRQGIPVGIRGIGKSGQ